MGIRGLLPFIDAGIESIPLSNLKGKVVGVDAYIWLYKGTCCCAKYLATGMPTTVHIEYLVSQVKKLLQLGVKPILVFDGVSPPMKCGQEDLRRARRAAKLQEANVELQKDNPNLLRVNELYKQSVSISHKDSVQAMKKCREIGVDCMVAPMESDAQLTYLQKIGLIDYIMSEDSDLITYGRPAYTKVLLKVNFSTMSAELLSLDKVFSPFSARFKDFTFSMFQTMCILAGCDYLSSIKRVGISTAYKITKEYQHIEPILDALKQRKYDVPANYATNYSRCYNIFLYHKVYDPFRCSQLSLNDVPESICQAAFSDFSPVLPENDIFDFVIGNITPSSGEHKENFDIKMVIPINIYFIQLFKRRPELYIPNYLAPAIVQIRDEDPARACQSDLHDFVKEFLVVGGRHHLNMHTNLDLAYNHYLQKCPVTVKLTLDPENEIDNNAILVHLDFGGGLKPVGYIARESTKYLIPVLKNNEPVSAEIKHMRLEYCQPLLDTL